MLGGFQFGRVFLVLVAESGNVFMAVKGVVVEVHLGVQRRDLAAGGNHQRVDLDDGGIQFVEGFVHGEHELDRRADLLAFEPEPEGQLAGVIGQHPGGRVDGDF